MYRLDFVETDVTGRVCIYIEHAREIRHNSRNGKIDFEAGEEKLFGVTLWSLVRREGQCFGSCGSNLLFSISRKQ